MGTNLARERDQMMFAQAGNVDLANQNHFVMILRKYSAIDHVCTEKISPFQPLGYTDARRRREKNGGWGESMRHINDNDTKGRMYDDEW